MTVMTVTTTGAPLFICRSCLPCSCGVAVCKILHSRAVLWPQEGAVPDGQQGSGGGGGGGGGDGLDFEGFLDFLLAWEHRDAEPGLRYLWSALDLRRRGYLSRVRPHRRSNTA